MWNEEHPGADNVQWEAGISSPRPGTLGWYIEWDFHRKRHMKRFNSLLHFRPWYIASQVKVGTLMYHPTSANLAFSALSKQVQVETTKDFVTNLDLCCTVKVGRFMDLINLYESDIMI